MVTGNRGQNRYSLTLQDVGGIEHRLARFQNQNICRVARESQKRSYGSAFEKVTGAPSLICSTSPSIATSSASEIS